jgi:hypothetical protein
MRMRMHSMHSSADATTIRCCSCRETAHRRRDAAARKRGRSGSPATRCARSRGRRRTRQTREVVCRRRRCECGGRHRCRMISPQAGRCGNPSSGGAGRRGRRRSRSDCGARRGARRRGTCKCATHGRVDWGVHRELRCVVWCRSAWRIRTRNASNVALSTLTKGKPHQRQLSAHTPSRTRCAVTIQNEPQVSACALSLLLAPPPILTHRGLQGLSARRTAAAASQISHGQERNDTAAQDDRTRTEAQWSR